MAKRKSKPKPGTAAELAELFPGPRLIPVKIKTITGANGARKTEWLDREIAVEPLTIEEVGKLVKALGPLARAGVSADLLSLAAEHPEEIIATVAVGCSMPAAEVRMMDPVGFMAVASAVFEANENFFIRLLVPLVYGRTAMEADPVGVGRTPSGISEGTEIPLPSGSH